jgi:hypothetical protein
MDAPPRSPDWVRDFARAAAADARAYLRTVRAFTFAASQSARKWETGELAAMNPLGVLASAAVVVGPVRQLALAVLGLPGADGLVAAVLSSLGPFVYYVVLGAIVHAMLRLLSPGRPRVTDSIAMSLYAGGGPAAAAEVLVWVVAIAVHPLIPRGTEAVVLGVSLGLAFSVFCVALATALATIHRAAWWQVTLAYVAALTLTGVFFGEVGPPGQYGMHWVVKVVDAAGHFAPRLWLGW